MIPARFAARDLLVASKDGSSARVFDAATARTFEVTAFQASLLEGAGHFADLETHASLACQRLTIDPGQAEAIVQRFLELHAKGLLQREDEARAALREAAPRFASTFDPDRVRAGISEDLWAFATSGTHGSWNSLLLGDPTITTLTPEGQLTVGPREKEVVVAEHAPLTFLGDSKTSDRANLDSELVGRRVGDIESRLVLDLAPPRFLRHHETGLVRFGVIGEARQGRARASRSLCLGRSGPSAGGVIVHRAELMAPFHPLGTRCFVEVMLLAFPADLVAYVPAAIEVNGPVWLDGDDAIALLLRTAEVSEHVGDPASRMVAVSRQLEAMLQQPADVLIRRLRLLHYQRCAELLAELEGAEAQESEIQEVQKELTADPQWGESIDALITSGRRYADLLRAWAHGG